MKPKCSISCFVARGKSAEETREDAGDPRENSSSASSESRDCVSGIPPNGPDKRREDVLWRMLSH